MRTFLATVVAIGLAVSTTSTLASPARARPAGDVEPAPAALKAPALSAAQVARLDAAVRESLGDKPGGVVAALWVPGKGEWHTALGRANLHTGEPIDASMQMPIGSVTKTFTGTLVLQQVEKGTLSLDDTLDNWYPSVPKADQITIAMLLNMSSGIGDHLGDPAFLHFFAEAYADPQRVYAPDDLIAYGAALPRQFDVPGSAFAYSNVNTLLLGRILEKVTGKTYETLLTEDLLTPLGLSRTQLRTTGGLQSPHPQLYSTFGPYIGAPALMNVTDWLNTEGWSAGAILSTLDDLHTWGISLGTGRGVLRASTQRQRFDNCISRDSLGRVEIAYCLGSGVTRYLDTGEVKSIWHTGEIIGGVAYLGYYPTTGAVLAVLANSDANDAAGNSVAASSVLRIQQAVPGLLGLVH